MFLLYDFLKQQMLKTPDKTINDEKQTITYSELLDFAESFGVSLIKQKYGICCKSELNTARMLFACLYAGKTAVLLSPRYGEKHSQKIIETINLSFIITDENITQIKSENEESEEIYDVPVIMCTSGTTGAPKGAMITDENLITNLIDIHYYFNINCNDRILITRPLYHCAVLTGEFFIALMKGLDITFYNGEFNPIRVIEQIRQQYITVMCGTPTLFYHLCYVSKRQSDELSLRTIAISGECMTSAVATIIRKTMPDVDVYNVYGLTEASPRVSYLPTNLFDKYPTSVGLPLNSLSVKIVDHELLIKGKSIMKGYYNDPSATRKCIDNEWLHTGDIAEIDKNGFIFIKSRKDNMIIRAGMNIYPQEIENALKKNDNIEEVLAFGVRDEKTGQKIHLKVVGSKLTKTQVFELCKKHLPSYQFPDFIEIVTEISKNSSGKVIRPKEFFYVEN